MNYREIRRATVWSYEFHRRIDGRVPPPEGTRPYEKLPIPTDLAIVHITLLVDAAWDHHVGLSPEMSRGLLAGRLFLGKETVCHVKRQALPRHRTPSVFF